MTPDISAIEARHHEDSHDPICFECVQPWPCDAYQLVQQLREALAAVEKYGLKHLRGCHVFMPYDTGCDCGMESALATHALDAGEET